MIMEYLLEHADVVTALMTLGLIGVTAGLWYATATMARSSKATSDATQLLSDATQLLVEENRAFREDAKRPQILAKLKPMVEAGEFIQLVLNNSGRGSALNVSVTLEGDEEDFQSKDIGFRKTGSPINFMSQGECEIYEFGVAHVLFSDPVLEPFSLVVRYEDSEGQRYKERIEMDVRQFDGLEWSGTSVSWRQMVALERIEKKLGSNGV